jgi:hypothetical protein
LDQAARRLTFRHDFLVSIDCRAVTHDAFAHGSIGDRDDVIARVKQALSTSERSAIVACNSIGPQEMARANLP